MATSWYYAADNRQIGPVTESELDALAATGVIRNETLVWREGLPDWMPFASARPETSSPVAPEASPEATRYCTNCGRLTPERELAAFGDRLICATCKPMFVHQLRERGLPSSGFQYAGFWIRFAARLIDGILLYIVYLPLAFLMMGTRAITEDPSTGMSGGVLFMQGMLVFFQLVFSAVYEIFFLVRFAATPGKMAVGKKVIFADGMPITFGRALGRHLATYISHFTLGIGYIMAAFDSEKRALHDRICDTRVVAK